MSLRWVSRWAVVVLAMLVSPSLVLAQAEFGVKGGLSFGNISNKGLLPGDLGNRTGFAAGAAAGYRARVIGIGVEALFAQRGLSADPGDTKLDYVDIPVYLKVELPTEGISPFAIIGPQVSFEVTCKVGDADCPDGGDRATTDYAGIAGVGVKFGSERKFGITVEARYIYGLKDLKIATITSDESFKTRSFLILAGLIF